MCDIVFEVEAQVELKSFFGNRLENQGRNYKVIALQMKKATTKTTVAVS